MYGNVGQTSRTREPESKWTHHSKVWTRNCFHIGVLAARASPFIIHVDSDISKLRFMRKIPIVLFSAKCVSSWRNVIHTMHYSLSTKRIHSRARASIHQWDALIGQFPWKTIPTRVRAMRGVPFIHPIFIGVSLLPHVSAWDRNSQRDVLWNIADMWAQSRGNIFGGPKSIRKLERNRKHEPSSLRGYYVRHASIDSASNLNSII